ncbi:hypothetical protein CHI07_04305 [Paenibacillus sp. 7884-2]|nr:hypothetical protein CHI07_04305 [Paenibacillus sp. 7884-2]
MTSLIFLKKWSFKISFTIKVEEASIPDAVDIIAAATAAKTMPRSPVGNVSKAILENTFWVFWILGRTTSAHIPIITIAMEYINTDKYTASSGCF